jgi:hypothetical protein
LGTIGRGLDSEQQYGKLSSSLFIPLGTRYLPDALFAVLVELIRSKVSVFRFKSEYYVEINTDSG